MDKFSWWQELTHGGLFISSPVLTEIFTDTTVDTNDWKYRRLRDHYNSFRAKEEHYTSGTHPVHSWITHILQDFLGHNPDKWLKGRNIPSKFSVISQMGLSLKPQRVLVDEKGKPVLLLQTDRSDRLGMYRGRRSYAQFVELLRRTNTSLGILTNGHQIRLVYAGLDHDAWVQWQTDAWFDEGETRHQLDGFVILLSKESLTKVDGVFPLQKAVMLSRTRQADLTDVLGDQIRQAVEKLTSSIGLVYQSNPTFLDVVQISPDEKSILTEMELLSAIYQAATRLVMRMVILFYAEAKALLPIENSFYQENYSLEGLYTKLSEATQKEGEQDLETHYSAWLQFLALSYLVHQGVDLPIETENYEMVSIKAYGGTLFKKGEVKSSDPVLRALALFENPKVQINDHTMYSILRLIKIGKTRIRQGRGSTWVSGPVDFSDLRTEYIGMMYEGLLDYELKIVEQSASKVVLNIGNQPILPLKLLEPMDDRAIKNLFDKMKVENKSTSDTDTDEGESSVEFDENHIDDKTTYGKALRWAVNAVEVARLIPRPRSRSSVAMQQYDIRKLEKARSLIIKVLQPGEMYLVRWGGTRKGSGTFYTKPSLAVPTTQRTIRPLVHNEAGELIAPDEILNLKICDPAVGSGTFLVAAARYLTEILYESMLTHTLTSRDEDGNVIDIPERIQLCDKIYVKPPPLKFDDDGWQDQMKARLKRLIVEHCLFGVDYNGMAVELARLALWLETMDKELPFEFLDHRIKQGNSLVGCWFSEYQNYPAKAWERQDGTGKDKNNKAILRKQIIPEIVNILTQKGRQKALFVEVEEPDITLDRQLDFWKQLEDTELFDTEKREEIYHEKIEKDTAYQNLKSQFNRWCAIWFWPSEDESKPILSPYAHFAEDDAITDIVKDLNARYHFFHWELEFPEVFVKTGQKRETGFDIILGNPPWDIQKPNSQEFFSNFDPIYRTYGKQEALRKQKQMFEESENIEKEWLSYSSGFKALSNYVRNAHDPYDVSLARGQKNAYLKETWNNHRRKQSFQHSNAHPYSILGGADLNLYKLFLEQVNHLLKQGGRLGMIIPSGIYTDKGSTDLRKTFLYKSDWEWLFAFENKMKLFDIDSRIKFGPLILTKGGETNSIKCAFMRRDVKEWESPSPPYIEIPVEKIKRFSPNTLSFMEFKSEMDLQICEKIYGDRPLLGDQVKGGWNVKFAREFDMTNDSHLFTSRRKLEEMGLLTPEEDTRDPRVRVRLWKDGYVPLYKGEYIWHFITYRYGSFEFEKFMQISDTKEKYYSKGLTRDRKIVFRKLGQSTNERNAIAATLPFYIGTGNSLGVLDSDYLDELYLLYNSFVFDFSLRLKIDKNTNESFLNTCPVLDPNDIQTILTKAPRFRDLVNNNPHPIQHSLLLRVEWDAIISHLYDLDEELMKGLMNHFSLVDRNVEDSQRQTTLTLEAFKHLKKVGLKRFLEEGWELPDYVTEFDRPGIKIWEPEGGWEKAWEEAKSMLTEKEWKEFTGDKSIQSEQISEPVEEYGQADIWEKN